LRQQNASAVGGVFGFHLDIELFQNSLPQRR
jgi:hypothetical protein